MFYGIHKLISSNGKFNIMRYPICLLAFSLFLLQSSTQESFEDQLIGVWVQTDYENEVFTYTRAQSFSKRSPGIEFKTGGKLIKRQNVGWCGTPPISYGNIDGMWSRSADSSLSIEYEFWTGTANQKWEVVELNKSVLKVRISESLIEKPKTAKLNSDAY